jgi:hypothetical protein
MPALAIVPNIIEIFKVEISPCPCDIDAVEHLKPKPTLAIVPLVYIKNRRDCT